MLGRTVDDCQRYRTVDAVWDGVLSRLRALDALFVNLECCLSTRCRPWQRTDCSFHFYADPKWAVLALSAADIAYSGAGRDAQATDPDLLIASLHWGPNMTMAVFDRHREVGHWLLDRGVDVVHGHSAHVFTAVEVAADGLLMYDCGDFPDDYAVNDALHNDRSLLFELTVSDDGTPQTLRPVPVEIRGCAVHPAPDDVARWCRETMRERSREFGMAFEREDGSLVVEC